MGDSKKAVKSDVNSG